MRERLKRALELYEHVAAICELLKWSGLWKFIAAPAAVCASAFGYWMHVSMALPLPVLVLIGLFVFAVLLFIAGVARAYIVVGTQGAAIGRTTSAGSRRRGKGPQLTINAYGSGNRLSVDDDYFYYSLIIQNTQALYEARAYELAASLLFEPAVKGNGKPFVMDRALFLRRQPTGTESFSEMVDLGMNETAEILLVVMNEKTGRKAIAPNSWPPQPGAPMLSLGEWTCAASVRGVNLRKTSRRFKISVQRSRVVIVPF